MVERGAKGNGGWDGVYFEVVPGSGASWEKRFIEAGASPTSRSQCTLYAADPDGNRFGVSSFPDPLFG